MLTFKYVRASSIQEVLALLRHPDLTYFNGDFPDAEWIGEFFNDGGHVYGAFEDDLLVGVIIAEDIKAQGVLLWYIATKDKNQGIGTRLIKAFEAMLEADGYTWLFLNATTASRGFYEKNDYLGRKEPVFEYFKGLES